jgi:ATP-dependent helicase/nuclease subunit A
LPDLAVERRRELAQNYLAGNAKGWTAEERDALVDRVLTLITDFRFAAVFAAGSRAEVPIVGRLERPGGLPALVSGQIDRLVVMPAEILIVDYKTNHAPPATAAEAPEGYVRQLALYRAVLSRLYPQRSIRAALLWTETPDLMEISAPALDAGLALLSSPREPA